jgi:uncharacterized OsmC-like protein
MRPIKPATLTLRIDNETRDTLVALAIKLRCSVADIVREGIAKQIVRLSGKGRVG